MSISTTVHSLMNSNEVKGTSKVNQTSMDTVKPSHPADLSPISHTNATHHDAAPASHSAGIKEALLTHFSGLALPTNFHHVLEALTGHDGRYGPGQGEHGNLPTHSHEPHSIPVDDSGAGNPGSGGSVSDNPVDDGSTSGGGSTSETPVDGGSISDGGGSTSETPIGDAPTSGGSGSTSETPLDGGSTPVGDGTVSANPIDTGSVSDNPANDSTSISNPLDGSGSTLDGAGASLADQNVVSSDPPSLLNQNTNVELLNTSNSLESGKAAPSESSSPALDGEAVGIPVSFDSGSLLVDSTKIGSAETAPQSQNTSQGTTLSTQDVLDTGSSVVLAPSGGAQSSPLSPPISAADSASTTSHTSIEFVHSMSMQPAAIEVQPQVHAIA